MADLVKSQLSGKANVEVHGTLWKCRVPRPVDGYISHYRDSGFRGHPEEGGAAGVEMCVSWR